MGLEALETDVGPLLAADCRLAVAGTLRDELRIQDLLHEAPEVRRLRRAAPGRRRPSGRCGVVAAHRRAAERRRCPGEVKGAASRVDSMGASDAVARAIGALQSAAVGSPAFVSV